MAPGIQTEEGNHAWILSFTGQMAATVASTLAPRSVMMPSPSSIVVALFSLQQMDALQPAADGRLWEHMPGHMMMHVVCHKVIA